MTAADRIPTEPIPTGAESTSDAELAAAVWCALSTVVDPELDEPITDLGFVRECTVGGDAARVRLRLPTAFCSPSFAYLMSADAYDAVTAVPGVRHVHLTLDDHSDSATINAGIAAQLGFAQAYGYGTGAGAPAETNAELHALRLVFQRKAHQAYVERACSAMVAAGWPVEALDQLRLDDLPAGRLRQGLRQGLRQRRADLGLSVTDDSKVCVDEAGIPWPADELPRRLRFAKAVRVSIDGNAHFCRGLLRTRYPGAAEDQRQREHELIPHIPLRSER